jgi:serine/threonine-protein kinase TNNI3K
MAPEVMNGSVYDFAADVHSFAILLWEICTLDKAFSKARSPQQLMKMVIMANDRPPVKKIAIPVVKDTIRASWHPKAELRPSFSLVANVLESYKSAKRLIFI